MALLVYLVIAISQLRMRHQLIATGKPLEFSMWLYPWLTWLVILFILAVLGIMLAMPDHRAEVLATGMLTAVIVCLGLLDSRKGKAKAETLGLARAE
ncbi:putative GABA permease [compost metagenome]